MKIADPQLLTPNDFEIAVKQALRDTMPRGSKLDFAIHGKRKVRGIDGEYEIDASAEFEVFGTKIKILIECKHHNKPVNRDLVMTLLTKLHSTAMHKAIMVSISGFQSGAVRFAKSHGIALIHIMDENSATIAKSDSGLHTKGPTTYVGWIILPSEGGFSESLLERASLEEAFTPELTANHENSDI